MRMKNDFQIKGLALTLVLNRGPEELGKRLFKKLECTQEARVALGCRLVQLLRIFRALQTSRVHP